MILPRTLRGAMTLYQDYDIFTETPWMLNTPIKVVFGALIRLVPK